MSRRLVAGCVLGAAVLIGAGALATIAARGLSATDSRIPTVTVRRDRLEPIVHARGELRSAGATTLAAPSVTGTLNIVTLTPSGTVVTAGEVVIEFDSAEQDFQIDEARSTLREAELEIEKLQAEAAVAAAEAGVALLEARFAVRQAELALEGRELLPALDVRKNELTLEESRRILAQLQADESRRADTNRAALEVLEEKRRNARLSLDEASRQRDALRVTAPRSGIVSVLQNRDASGGMYFSGMVLPPYREGDTVRPGRPIAEIVDATDLEVAVTVAEADRAALAVGLEAEIRVDGAPDRVLTARVEAIGGIAARQRFDAASGPAFDTVLALTSGPDGFTPGQTLAVTLNGEPMESVLVVPRQVVHERDGRTFVSLETPSGFEPREVRVVGRSETHVAIDGVPEGAQVALVPPDRTGGAADPAAADPAALGRATP